MAPEIVASMITGGAALAGGTSGNILNYFSAEKADKTNIALARENRQWMLEQWQRENAYNDPRFVMSRLAGAGLNPNLAFAGGASGMLSSSAQSPSPDAPHVNAPQVDPSVAASAANIAADTYLKKSQADLNNSQIDVNKGIIKVNDSVVVYNSALTNMTKAQQDYIVGQTNMLGTLTEKANSEIAKNYAEIQNMQEGQRIRWFEASLKEKEVDALIDKYAAEAGFTREQCKYYAVLALAKVANLKADAALKYAQVDLTNSQKEQVDQYTANLTVVNKQLNWAYNQSVKYDDQKNALLLMQMATEIAGNAAGHNILEFLSAPFRDDIRVNVQKNAGIN